MASTTQLLPVSPRSNSSLGQTSAATISSIERALEEAQSTGELLLTSRGLRDIPKQAKCDLADVTVVGEFSLHFLVQSCLPFSYILTSYWCRPSDSCCEIIDALCRMKRNRRFSKFQLSTRCTFIL